MSPADPVDAQAVEAQANAVHGHTHADIFTRLAINIDRSHAAIIDLQDRSTARIEQQSRQPVAVADRHLAQPH